MTFSYAGPGESSTDTVRYLLQDTVETAPLLQDEEIAYEVSAQTTNYGDGCEVAVAAACAEVIAGRFARSISISADGVSTGADQLQSKYEELAKALWARWERERGMGAEPTVGNLELPDPCVPAGNFAVGMDDNLNAGPQVHGDRWGYPGVYGYNELEGGVVPY